MRRKAFALLALVLPLAACGGGGSRGFAGGSTTTGSTCMIPPGPAPVIYLLYPAPNSTNVSTTADELDFAALSPGYVNENATVTLSSASGAQVSGSAPIPTTTPLPQGAATPPPSSAAYSYIKSTIPTLNSSTPYTVNLAITQYANLPVACQKHFTLTLGQFTTH